MLDENQSWLKPSAEASLKKEILHSEPAFEFVNVSQISLLNTQIFTFNPCLEKTENIL